MQFMLKIYEGPAIFLQKYNQVKIRKISTSWVAFLCFLYLHFFFNWKTFIMQLLALDKIEHGTFAQTTAPLVMFSITQTSFTLDILLH